MKRIELKYGIYMFLGFVSFFFAMKAMGLYTNINLRIFNILIHSAFAFLAMRAYRSQAQEPFGFLPTFAVGFRTSIMAVLAFALFQFVYLQFADPNFMEFIRGHAIMGNSLTPAFSSFFLVIEGLGVSIFSAYVGMRALTVIERVPPLS